MGAKMTEGIVVGDLVNPEYLTSKSKTGGGSKNCVAWKVEKAMHYFAHRDTVT